ncbi:hypothetical protein TYRP_022455 [Tyrophagus putrescentiae]|nr:hypothetical protein TYRP_022455 [Tyrophagus putrescentiae]
MSRKSSSKSSSSFSSSFSSLAFPSKRRSSYPGNGGVGNTGAGCCDCWAGNIRRMAASCPYVSRSASPAPPSSGMTVCSSSSTTRVKASCTLRPVRADTSKKLPGVGGLVVGAGQVGLGAQQRQGNAVRAAHLVAVAQPPRQPLRMPKGLPVGDVVEEDDAELSVCSPVNLLIKGVGQVDLEDDGDQVGVQAQTADVPGRKERGAEGAIRLGALVRKAGHLQGGGLQKVPGQRPTPGAIAAEKGHANVLQRRPLLTLHSVESAEAWTFCRGTAY